jgi:hypothetical protein
MGQYAIRNVLARHITDNPHRVSQTEKSDGILLKVMKDSSEYPYLKLLQLFQENSYFQGKVNELQ